MKQAVVHSGAPDEAVGGDPLAPALAAVDIGIALYDAAGRFVACNGRYRDLLPGAETVLHRGAERRLILAHHAETVFDPGEAERLARLGADAAPAAPQVFQCRDGRWLELDGRPLPDGSLVCLWTDVTRRLDAETEVVRLQGRLRDAIQCLPDGFALFDADDRLDLHNSAFAERYGLPAGESVVGLPHHELFDRLVEHGLRGADGGPPDRGAVDGGHALREPVERRLADGRWIRIAETRTQDGGIVGIHSDVTDFKRREAELARRTALLDAVTHAATRIIGRGDWQSGVPDLLERLGRALRVGRAALYRVTAAAGCVVQSCSHVWTSTGGADRARTADRLDRGDGSLDGWMLRLRRGDPILGRAVDFAGPLRATLDARGAYSHLAVPIIVGAEWWGHLAFDDPDEERGWSPLEVDVLVTAATMLASAIQRSVLDDRLRRSEARKQAIVETAVDCILTVDAAGRLVEFNPAAERTLGWTRAEAIGQRMDALVIPAEHRAAFRRGVGDYADGRGGEGADGIIGRRQEMTALRRDGSTFPCELTITATRVAGELFFTAYLRDITERREAEDALVGAKTRAEAAARAKSAFLNTMSHELRTPLNAIIGFSEIIREQVMGPLGSSKYQEFAADIHESGKHLLRIINDVLDMSRIEAGEHPLALEPVDLGTLVQSCLQLVRERAHKGGVALVDATGPLPITVNADRRALMKVLLNLLSNAVKFTPPGGSATVSAAALPDGAVTLTVADTGVGIAPAALAHVFEPFQQGDMELNRQHEGAGLGLSLARALVGLHGGTVALDSALGQGTTVTVRLPAARDAV